MTVNMERVNDRIRLVRKLRQFCQSLEGEGFPSEDVTDGLFHIAYDRINNHDEYQDWAIDIGNVVRCAYETRPD